MQDLLKKLLFGNAGGGNGGAPALSLSFTDGGTFDPRITFSRGTNATLTGSDGLIQYAPHNLLTNSEDFEAAAWNKGNVTVTANAAIAPDGSATADNLVTVATTAITGPFTVAGVASATNTQSFYVKQNVGIRYVQLLWTSSATSADFADFDLQTGTLTAGTYAGATIASAGNGWYRISLTSALSATAGGPWLIAIPTSTAGRGATYVGNGTDALLVWGAQLNVGALQSYNSTTPKNLLGFTQEPENAAWTKSNSYVQQNLLTWSQDFDNAAWVKSAGASVTANSTIAPDGALTADTVTFAASSDFINQQLLSYSAVNGQSVTFSIYARTATQLIVFGGASPAGTDVFTATAVGGGWFRQVVTRTFTVTVSGTLQLVPSGSIIGAGSFPIWGAQLVQGSTAGDYTQTTSAAAVTRYVNWDGTLTGRKLVEDTANAFHGVNVLSTLVSNVRYTQSVYAKAGERQWMMMAEGNNVSASAWFNLSSGALGTVSGTGTPAATITNIGGGWYRCSLSYTPIANAGNTQARPTTGDNVTSYTGDGTSGIYVSDFQLSNSASVDPYVYNPQAAAASAAFYGPRVDYNPVTLASNGLLIEEQRANLLTYSEQFDNAAWTKQSNVTITANSAVAPDGTTTAETFASSGVTNNGFYQLPAGSNSTAYTGSIYLKAGTASVVQFGLATNGETNTAYYSFDLSAVTATVATSGFISQSASITHVGNGWYRCVVSGTTPATGVTNIAIFPRLFAAANVLVWGAQLEAGAFATSYIPTVASQVTRNADSASMLGDNFYTWYNPNQGTLSAEVQKLSPSSVSTYAYELLGASSNFSMRVRMQSDGRMQSVDGGSVQVDSQIQGTVPTTASKYAFAYRPNDYAGSANGGAAVADTSGTVPVVSSLSVGSVAVSGLYVRRISYYSTRLSDASLQQITS